uniref:Uncharacterized protein n=1 Tax=Cacopsylla melanoneura TaxID=428564 RepID=A0A8D8VPS4_9HEMI
MTTTAPCKKNPKIQLFIYFITYVHYNNIPKSIRCFKSSIRILAINLTFLTRLTRLYSNTLFVFTRTLIGNPQIPTRYHQCLVFSFQFSWCPCPKFLSSVYIPQTFTSRNWGESMG